MEIQARKERKAGKGNQLAGGSLFRTSELQSFRAKEVRNQRSEVRSRKTDDRRQ